MKGDTEDVEKGFWNKMERAVAHVPFLRKAIAMYHCMLDERTPAIPGVLPRRDAWTTWR